MGGGAMNKVEVNKGPWTRDEDQKLLSYIQQHGHGSWRALPEKAGLERCGKSCRLRWTNYLRPDIKRGKFSSHEEKSIIRLHALLGNRWSVIAAHLPNRTDNEIKNYWNTRLKKRLTRMGIDPATHKPRNTTAGSADSKQLSHMAQWEAARVEAEARQTLLPNNLYLFRRATAPPPLPPPCLDVLKVWQSTTLLCNLFTLDSPTSMPNVSGDGPAVPAVVPVKDNDVASTTSCAEGKMENSSQLHDVIYDCDVDVMMGSLDQSSYNHDFDVVGSALEDYDDIKISCWNELLHLVGSTMDSSALLPNFTF